MSVWAVVLACGKDQEISAGVDVAFLALGQRPVLAYSLYTLEQNEQVDGIILVLKKERVDTALQMIRTFGLRKVKSIVAGGGQRLACLKKAYDQLPDGATTILIHDAARPFVESDVITETVKAGKRYGSAVAAQRSFDAVKLAEKGQKVTKTLDRSTIWLAQSPQAFKRDIFEKMIKSGLKMVDDESGLLEKTRQETHLVMSSAENIKIRTVKDLEAASVKANAAQ
ncbi:MAG: 2-C-methyl-D-erythritol 4-phosphate cytidylyltransferase [Kiritimatiellaceae bacterium]|nr:2-C-methyl-D-erythritol 4-phosphate cytidylyltransferase [Kiritimatiellaceae bacterium]